VQGAGEAQALRVAQGADVTLKALTPSGLHPPRARALPLGPAVARADLAMKPVEEPVEVRGEAGGVIHGDHLLWRSGSARAQLPGSRTRPRRCRDGR
jgi:hypothetical protein